MAKSPTHALSQSPSHAERPVICEPSDAQPLGFFSLSPNGENKINWKWGFPENSVRINHFACLHPGKVILHHLQMLASHLPDKSILLCLQSSLRDAHWAAVKAGFRSLGDCETMVGSFVWLYLDRENRHDEIQAKLRQSKFVR